MILNTFFNTCEKNQEGLVDFVMQQLHIMYMYLHATIFAGCSFNGMAMHPSIETVNFQSSKTMWVTIYCMGRYMYNVGHYVLPGHTNHGRNVVDTCM